MRLGDLEQLKEEILWGNVYLLEKEVNALVDEVNALVDAVDNQPTIDPETLPIVQKLREQLEQTKIELEAMRTAANSLKMHLEKVTQERDALLQKM